MTLKNEVKIEFPGLPVNIALARVTMAAFASQLDLTLQDLDEIKLVVSEAVSNAIVHGYQNCLGGIVTVKGCINDNQLEIIVADKGSGILNVEQALAPTFSADNDRLGMGFAFMQSLMDNVQVNSQPGWGTEVRMVKSFLLKDNTKAN